MLMLCSQLSTTARSSINYHKQMNQHSKRQRAEYINTGDQNKLKSPRGVYVSLLTSKDFHSFYIHSTYSFDSPSFCDAFFSADLASISSLVRILTASLE